MLPRDYKKLESILRFDIRTFATQSDEFSINKIFNIVPVTEELAGYHIFGEGFKTPRYEDLIVESGIQTVKKQEYPRSKDSYDLKEVALGQDFDLHTLSKSRNLANFLSTSLNDVKIAIQRSVEQKGVSLLTDTTNYITSNTYDLDNPITDPVNSFILEEIETAKSKCFIQPNVIAMNSYVWGILKNTPNARQNDRTLTIEEFEMLTGLKLVLFNSKVDSTSNGIEENLGYIFPSDKIWIGYVHQGVIPENVDTITTFGCDFSMNGVREINFNGIQLRMEYIDGYGAYISQIQRGTTGGISCILSKKHDFKITGKNAAGKANLGVLLTKVTV